MGCFRVSETRLWKSWRRSVLPLVCLVIIFISIVGSLSGCYVMARDNGHLTDYRGSLPPISALGGNYPEQGLFIAGFTVCAICSAVMVTYRAAHVDEVVPGHGVNVFLLVLAWLGLPFLIVMASISMYSDAWGWLHLTAAAIGLVALASFSCWNSVLVLYLTLRSSDVKRLPDERVPRGFRIFLLCFCGFFGLMAPVFFGIWAIDVQRTVFEWLALLFIFVALLPYFVLFFHARRTAAPGYLELQ